MFYDFPPDLELDEVRSVVARQNYHLGVDAYIEADRGDFIIFNYLISFAGVFPAISRQPHLTAREAAILRECRGLIFHKDGELVSRRYHKFFNFRQNEEVQDAVVDFSQPFIIMDKLDGSMLTPLKLSDDTIRWATKMGLTGVAEPVDDFVKDHPDIEAFARECIDFGITPIFEWCSRKQRIVIDYPEDQLILTAMRDNHSGRYLSYASMQRAADAWGLDLVEVHELKVTSLHELMLHTKGLIGTEGFVLRFENGHMLKFKAEDYCIKHSAKDEITSEKKLIAILVQEKLDDLLPLLDGRDRDEVTKFANAFEHGILHSANELLNKVEGERALLGNDKKAFALKLNAENHSKKSLLFSIWDDNDPVEVVRSHVGKHLGSSTRVAQVRDLFGGVEWKWGEAVAGSLDD